MRILATNLSFLLASSALLVQPVNAQSPAPLQVLVNDTAAQFQLAYRHNVAEHRRRYDELSHAVAEWRAADRSEENNRLLAEWLRNAMRRSMPGSREGLPPVPQFSSQTAETEPPSLPADDSLGDPFGDDP